MSEQTSAAKGRFSFDSGAVWIISLTALLSLVAYIPGNSVSLFGTKVTVLFVGVFLALIAFVIARLIKGSIVIPPLALLGALWFVPIAYLLSTLFSGANPLHALFGTEFETDTFGFTLLLALLATLSALIFRKSHEYLRLFWLIGIGLAIAVVAQIAFIVVGRTVPGLVSPADNLVGSFSDVGMLAGLAVVLSLMALRFFTHTRNAQIGFWALIVVSFFLLALVNSALNFILVGLMALGLFIEGMMRRRTTADDADLEGVSQFAAETEDAPTPASSRFIAAPLVVLLVSIFLLLGGAVIGNLLATVSGVNVIDVRPSWSSTFDIGSHVYASSPLFGSGPGTFSEQWLQFRDRSLNDTIFWNVDFGSGIGHIPTSFVTTGAIGVLAWLAFLGLFFFIGLRTFLFRLPVDPFVRFASLVSFGGAAFVLALAFFATPGPVVLALGFILLGVFVSTLRYSKDRPEWGIVFSRSPRLGFVIVFLMTLLMLASVGAGFLVIERYVANAAYGSSFRSLSAGNIDAAAEHISRSITYAPTDRAYRLAATVGIARMRAIAGDQTLPASVAQQQFQGALSASIGAGLEATRVQPNDYQNWVVLGNVYQSAASLKIVGAYAEAKAAYDRALTLNPSSPVIPYVLAQLEILESNTVAAEEYLLASVSLKRDYIPAILLLSQLKVQTGEAREALEAAEAAAYLAPNDPSVLLSVGLLRLGIGDRDGAIAALSRAIELNPQYANARFFLAAIYGNMGRTAESLAELRTIAAMSPENAQALTADIEALEKGTNPFPLARLRSLGIPQPPVVEPNAQTAQ